MSDSELFKPPPIELTKLEEPPKPNDYITAMAMEEMFDSNTMYILRVKEE